MLFFSFSVPCKILKPIFGHCASRKYQVVLTEMELRDYQCRIIDETRAQMQAGQKRILITSPTGSGKTVLTAFMMKQAMQKGLGSMLVVHRKELMEQTIATLRGVGLNPQIIQSGSSSGRRREKECGKKSANVTVASVQTLVRRLQKYSKPSLTIWDECHHLAAGSWSKCYEYYKESYHVGLSATPARLDGRGLGDYFDSIVHGPSVSDLIDMGYLAKYRLFAPPTEVDMRGVKRSMGDFSRMETGRRMDKPHITGRAVDHYKKHCPDKSAVVFCVNIAHSQHVAESFNQAGIPAVHIDGGTNERERKEGLARFRAGDIRVLCNCDLFGEGLDVPGIEAVFLLRPTQSTGLYMQQVGRALRPARDKPHALIFDHVGNCHRHGLPDDHREWSLQGLPNKEKRADAAPGVRVCSHCYAANRAARRTCEYCGEEFEVVRKLETRAGELEELGRDNKKSSKGGDDFRKERAGARSFGDLVKLGKQRGMKNPSGWAYHIMKSRSKKYGGM